MRFFLRKIVNSTILESFFSMWEEVTKILWNPFFLKWTSNEFFVFNAFRQNYKKLDIRVFSGQFREILILKN